MNAKRNRFGMMRQFIYNLFWVATFYGSKLLLYRMRVTGREYIPSSGPYIIASNHIGHLDPYILGIIFPKNMCYMTNSGQYKMPVWGATLKLIETIEGSGFKAMRLALKRLSQKRIVVFFPEGERVKSPFIKNGMPGAAAAALWAKVPVVPVRITGTDEALNVRTLSLKMGAMITVSIGKPIIFDDTYYNGGVARNAPRATKVIIEAINDLASVPPPHP